MVLNAEQLELLISKNAADDITSDSDSLMELLWCSYTRYRPIATDLVEVKFHQLDAILNSLSRKRSRRIHYIMEELCRECERKTFLTGIRLGIRITLELIDLYRPNDEKIPS